MHTAPEADWARAVQREAVIRPLAEASQVGRAAAQIAAERLGLSVARVYWLIRTFRAHPVTSSLLPHAPGQAIGARRLASAIDGRVEAAIDAIYLKPERPTMKRLFRLVRQECASAGLKPPSMKALRARVTARSLRERMKAREGAAAAGNQFRQVAIGLRTERPLQVVQIDHTKVDLMLVDDVTRVCIGRPWLTLVLDVHTRLVLGLYLSLEAPSATSVDLAVGQAALPNSVPVDSSSQCDGLASGCCLAPRPTPERVRFATGRGFGHLMTSRMPVSACGAAGSLTRCRRERLGFADLRAERRLRRPAGSA